MLTFLRTLSWACPLLTTRSSQNLSSLVPQSLAGCTPHILPPAASRLYFPSRQSLPTSLASCSSCPNRVDWHLPRVVSQAPQTQQNQERPHQLTPRVSQVPRPPLTRWLSQNLRVTLVSSPWKVVKLPQPVAKSLGSASEYPSICPLFSILTVTVLDTTTSIPPPWWSCLQPHSL